MAFFSQKVLRKFEGDYTFVIVTDRQELDDQVYKTFASVGAVTEGQVQAESGEHLKQALAGEPPQHLHSDPEVPHREG
jgi:type I restriction enzyme, R subunit